MKSAKIMILSVITDKNVFFIEIISYTFNRIETNEKILVLYFYLFAALWIGIDLFFNCYLVKKKRIIEIVKTIWRETMEKKIVKDVLFLAQKSEPATSKDIQVGIDLQDTLKAYRARCVGLAANMIGVKKNIIIVNMGLVDLVMFNPIILKKDTPYDTEEGCLSLEGMRKTKRY